MIIIRNVFIWAYVKRKLLHQHIKQHWFLGSSAIFPFGLLQVLGVAFAHCKKTKPIKNKTKQNKTKRNKTKTKNKNEYKQKTKQINKTKKTNKTKTNKTKQNRILFSFTNQGVFPGTYPYCHTDEET